ncbi:UDP-glucose/GDP-mannose dehydrogenase family protein [Nocardia abscessus]|uniref:UDP-glucose dehydrogenase family protein n=1 Tax=Nocardia abscessus TaxID=120957 RepID=UPI001893D0C3|nr:UDP-glucose/GDP-mannose dehydrogenase family protein [Nocardia abscessus]MBF6339948.1 UDP-glucose/GDP-mannose dehydrogenase family protein [Nocardia abscessus]
MGSRVGVVGAGYVGLTTAACLAHLGHHVVCVDNDESKVEALRAGTVPIVEPGLPELVREGLSENRLVFTSDPRALHECEVVLLCLPTPMGARGTADLGVIEDALARLSTVLPPDCVLVTKSTVPVGTAARIPALSGLASTAVISNPEFLREGHAVEDFLRPDRVLLGAAEQDRESADRVAALYAGTGAPVLRSDSASAELAKYASNAFLAVKLSFVNTLAELCERVGADITKVTGAMGMDDRIGPAFLAPGPGWGGSCLPKDTRALLRAAEAAGVDFAMLRAALRANDHQRAMVLRKIRRAATGTVDGSLSGTRIGVLGLAFKAGTGDLRESPAVAVARQLSLHEATVTAYDPCVPESGAPGLDGIRVVDDPYLVAKEADAIVILTEWPEFRSLDWARIATDVERAVIVDTRNLLDERLLSGTGFTLLSTGTARHDACQ